MKTLKLYVLSLVLVAGLCSSCSKDDSVTQDQNIQETQAITTSLNRLAGQFNSSGDVVPSANPSGNIVFDFGFDFIYPLNLSFNNGTSVTVNSLEDLIQVLINSTDDLFINGIEFPFDVEVYDENTDSIIVVTINNEDEFLELLESLDWENDDDCNCYEIYEPVCVEVTDPYGTTFVITYPNDCYALCDGFTPNDFVNNCEDDYNNSGGFECFEFNFPLSIITDTNETITVNSQEELDNALYNAYYFDFVYPFEVTDAEGNVEVIEDGEDLIDLLEDCYDDYEGCFLEIEFIEDALMFCDVFEVEVYQSNGNVQDSYDVEFNENGVLTVNGEPTVVDEGTWSVSITDNTNVLTIDGLQTFTLLNGTWLLSDCDEFELEFTNGDSFISFDLDCDDVVIEPCDDCSDEYDPVCVEVEENGVITYYSFQNACYAECEGFTQEDFVDCNGNNEGCTVDVVLAILLECPWRVNDATIYDFDDNGEVTITGSGLTTVGAWNIYLSNNGYPIVNIEANIGNFNDEWHFIDCNLQNNLQVNSTNNPIAVVVPDCD